MAVEGKLFAQYCENQTIICNQDISFCEYIMRCNTTTLGKLSVCEKRGLIVGGEIFAQMGVEANVIGNVSYVATSLEVGINKEAQEKFVAKNAELGLLQDELGIVEKSQKLLEKKRMRSDSQKRNKQSVLKKVE
jgi:uncharacterized protein (DUF342 family)